MARSICARKLRSRSSGSSPGLAGAGRQVRSTSLPQSTASRSSATSLPLRSNGGLQAWLAIIWNSRAASSVRIERAQTCQEAADIELELRRERPCERIADLQVDVDELLRSSELRLAVAEADARIPEQLVEQQELPLQLRFLQLCRRHLGPRSAVVNAICRLS